MKRAAVLFGLLLLAYVCHAATVYWYSSAPRVGTSGMAALGSNDIILIERPTPHTNLHTKVSDLGTFLLGEGFVLQGDSNFSLTIGTNGTVTISLNTNVVIHSQTVSVFSGTIGTWYYNQTTNSVIHSKGSSIEPWPGPTNSLSMDDSDWTYTMASDVSITNVTRSMPNVGVKRESVLTVTNGSGQDRVIRLPSNWWTRDGERAYTVTNNAMAHLYVHHYGLDPDHTNTMARFETYR